MADVLEAMGFPSDWCERALSSASGIETAVDLLLQWQAQGTPQFISPSLGPSSPGTSMLRQGGPSLSRPTLKLLPISTSDSKGMLNECEASPSSTLQPSCSSSEPSTSSGPSVLDESRAVNSPVVMPSGELASGPTVVSRGRNVGSLQEPLDRTTTTSISFVDDARAGSGRGAGTSRVANNAESSDAVVPDAFAEERKSRYAAAQRAKQEKEAEKEKIRQQLEDDKAQRRFRHTMMAPPDRPTVNRGKQPVGSSMPTGLTTESGVPTQLQIRCPRNQIIKGSFTAGTSLKEVRAYVERQLQRRHLSLDHREESSEFRPGSVPFSGSSSRLSSDRQAERMILQAARENFEAQTSRILASAKTLRQQQREAVGAEKDNQAKGTMYFLIPAPRQEFFTESAMESTLAQAQLVPRGTLIVQYRNGDTENKKTTQVQDSSTNVEESNKPDNRAGRSRATEACQNSMEPVQPGSKEQESPDSKSDDTQVKGPSQSKKISLSFEQGVNGASNIGRNSLDVDGERVRVRELALQAAAKRMSEAAKIFREGIPLGEGETGGAFPFPNGDNPYAYHMAAAESGYTALQQSGRTVPADNIISTNLKSAGADAELQDASPHAKERSSGSPSPHKPDKPRGRTLDALHRQAKAAAEARLRTSQCQPSLAGCSYEQEPEEAESRIGLEGSNSPPQRGRARVPASSRLLSRPEKLQRTSDCPPSCSPATCAGFSNQEELPGGSAEPQSQTSGSSYAGPFEAALERFNANSELDTKGKGPMVEDDESSRVATVSGSHQAQAERQIALRVRSEDGHVETLSFPANTLLQYVRDSVVPEGADASAYGFFINVPEPHYVEGDDLGVTLEEAGLASREIVHLLKMSSRGMVRQGRRPQHRRRRHVPIDDEAYNLVGMVPHVVDPHERQDLTYEELMELEESIGRVHVGVPVEVIAALPIHTVRSKKTGEVTEGDEHEEEVDVCIICMAEMVVGEEALTLPCVHTFHPLCIRRWLQQSTCCPTCKHGLI